MRAQTTHGSTTELWRPQQLAAGRRFPSPARVCHTVICNLLLSELGANSQSVKPESTGVEWSHGGCLLTFWPASSPCLPTVEAKADAKAEAVVVKVEEPASKKPSAAHVAVKVEAVKSVPAHAPAPAHAAVAGPVVAAVFDRHKKASELVQGVVAAHIAAHQAVQKAVADTVTQGVAAKVAVAQGAVKVATDLHKSKSDAVAAVVAKSG